MIRAAKHMLVTVFQGQTSDLCIKRGSGIFANPSPSSDAAWSIVGVAKQSALHHHLHQSRLSVHEGLLDQCFSHIRYG